MNQLPPLQLPSIELTFAESQVRRLLSRERRRTRFDAFVALALTLGFGWIYARLARELGAPPNMIGAIAVSAQAVTFAAAMIMRPHQWTMRRRK
jgi:hypothetical protein